MGHKLKLNAAESFLTCESGSLREAVLPCSQEREGVWGSQSSLLWLLRGPYPPSLGQSTVGVTSQLGPHIWEHGHFLNVGFPSEL